MSNPNYGLWNAAGTARNAAIAINQQITKSWKDTVRTRSGIYDYILRNKIGGVSTSESTREQFQLSVITAGPAIGAEGISDANQFNQLGISRSTGMTQAVFDAPLYALPVNFSMNELKKLRNGERGNLIEGRAKQIMTEFERRLAVDVASGTGSSETKLQGIMHVLSLTNTVGGINQTTTPNWRSNVEAVGGNMAFRRFDALVQAIRDRDGMPKIAIASTSGAYNVYNGVKEFLRGTVTYNDSDGDNANLGFDGFRYGSVKFVADRYIAGGTIAVLTPESWYLVGSVTATRYEEPQRMPNSVGFDTVYSLYCGLGCDAPGHNGVLTGITAVSAAGS